MKRVAAFAEILKQDPAIAHFAGYAVNTIQDRYLYDQEEMTVFQVIERLRRNSAVSSAILYLQASQEIVVRSRSKQRPVQYTLSAYDLPVLNHWTPLVQDKFSRSQVLRISANQLNHGLDVAQPIIRLLIPV